MDSWSVAPGGDAPDERPVELVAAALILYVVAVLPLLAGCLVGLLLASLGDVQMSVPAWLPPVLLAVLVVAGLTALLGYQIQRGREWARLTATALGAPLAGLGFVGGAYGALNTALAGIPFGAGAIVGVILVALLNTRPARAYCRDPRRPRGVAWPHYSEP